MNLKIKASSSDEKAAILEPEICLDTDLAIAELLDEYPIAIDESELSFRFLENLKFPEGEKRVNLQLLEILNL